MESKTILTFKLDGLPVKGRTGAKERNESPKIKHNEKRVKCEYTQTSEDELLNGLVGPRSVAVVNIENVQCQAILDSGSQVTTISKSFHDTYLSSLAILPLRDILEVEGAGGQIGRAHV